MRQPWITGSGAEWRRGAFAAVAGLGALACNALLDIEQAQLDPSAAAAGAAAAGLPPDDTMEAPGQSGATGDVGTTPGAPASGDVAAPVVPEPGPLAPPAASVPPPTTPEAAGPPTADGAGSAAPAPVASAPLGPPLDENGFAAALPNDLIDAPVRGEITFSEEAAWEVDGVFRPTFEVHTPTASYWVVASLGTLVSMQDAFAGRSQWIDFSSGFRPLRGIPAFAAPPASVSTVLDRDSQTPTHLRLTSQSPDGAWRWVWDFYVTHATFTVDRAPVPIGFSYRGVPAGGLGAEDQLVLSDGTAQGARNSFNADVTGPVEWVYFADTAAQRVLYLMQHRDDALPEAYQVRDNDSAAWTFGGGAITALPARFSLGLFDRVDHALVSQRAAYVAGAIR